MRELAPAADSAIAQFEHQFYRPARGRTLVAGSMIVGDRPDRRALYPEALGVDMREGPGVDLVLNLEDDLPADLVDAFWHVDCISVLEHTPRPWLAAQNLCKALRLGGTMFVTIPMAWRVHGYPDDYWRVTAHGLRSLFQPHILWTAMKYCGHRMQDVGERIDLIKHEDFPYIARTEVAGFGVRA
jgi:SAM-dependent methyltransferase